MVPALRVSVFLGLSLDGYLAREDHSLDWLSTVQTDPPEDTGYSSLMASVDVMVLGRTTHDVVTTFPEWPFTGKRVVVLTSRPLLARHGEETFDGELSDLVQQIRLAGHHHIYLDGGHVVRQALQAGVVTHLTLSWLPIMLGSGIALFSRTLTEQQWQLTSSQAFPSGLVQASYIVAAHPR